MTTRLTVTDIPLVRRIAVLRPRDRRRRRGKAGIAGGHGAGIAGRGPVGFSVGWHDYDCSAVRTV